MIFPLGVYNQNICAFILSPVRAKHVRLVPFTFYSSLICSPVLDLLIFQFCLAWPNVTVLTVPLHPYGVPLGCLPKPCFTPRQKYTFVWLWNTKYYDLDICVFFQYSKIIKVLQLWEVNLIARKQPVVNSWSIISGHNFERNTGSPILDCTKVGLLERTVRYKID